MGILPFSSKIYKDLFIDEEIFDLFSDKAHLSSIIEVEVAIAKTQGSLGIIPNKFASLIENKLKNIKIRPSELSTGTAKDGIVIPALVKILRKKIGGEAASYLHYGVTSQDIVDTALMVQLKDVILIFEKRIQLLIDTLSSFADQNRDIIMAARTRTQISTPTTFGLKVANWLAPFLRHNERLIQLKRRCLLLSFGDASGTLSVFSAEKNSVMINLLSKKLGLQPPLLPWHNQRDNIAEIGFFCSLTAGSVAKIAADVLFLSSSGIEEVFLNDVGLSSSMPQKRNPVLAETILALAQKISPLGISLFQAQIHKNERDGTSLQLEWMTLPEILNFTGAVINHCQKLIEAINVDPEKMSENIDKTMGTILSEAATYLLAAHMSKEEAQDIVGELSLEALSSKIHLYDLLSSKLDIDINWQKEKDLSRHLGGCNNFIDATILSKT